MRIRLLCALIGAWLLGTLFMAVTATSSFHTVDRILAPEHRQDFQQRLAPRTPGEERPLLRHLAAELNRRLFRRWSLAEVVFATALVALLFAGHGSSRHMRIVGVATALLAAVLALLLAPLIAQLGPPLDFVPRPFPPEWADAGRQFFLMHGLYSGLNLVKMVLLGWLLVLSLRQRPVDP